LQSGWARAGIATSRQNKARKKSAAGVVSEGTFGSKVHSSTASIPEEYAMQKTTTAIVAAASLAATVIAAPKPAEARCIGCWVGAGIAAAVIGGAFASRAYGYGYGYPAYGYGGYGGYGYPAYSYGYGGYGGYGGGYGYPAYSYGYGYPAGYSYAYAPVYRGYYAPRRYYGRRYYRY
jgi:hypothetical protein